MIMRRLLSLFFVFANGLAVNADEVQIGSLWYDVNIQTGVAKVIKYKNNTYYSGNIIIPSEITYNENQYTVSIIGEKAFESCNKLVSIVIPSSIKTFENQAFLSTFSIKEVHYDSLEALLDISFLGQVSTPVTDKYSTKVFFGDDEVTNVVIPEGVERIGNQTFENWSALTSVQLPSSLRSIGNYAFAGCMLLSNINIPSNVDHIGTYAFSWCKQISNITIPEKITTIEDGTFLACVSLEEIEIPYYVTSIGYNSFCDSGVSSVILPKSIETLGSGAFWGCYNLSHIYCYAETLPSTEWNSFPTTIGNITLYVNTNAIELYNSTSPWNEFGHIETLSKDITISSLGIATYCSDDDLDFTGVDGIKAYIASGYNNNTGNVLLTRVKEVPAGTGILLMGDGGTYEIPTTDVDYTYANLLVGTLEDTNLTSVVGYKNYILANGSSGVKFYLSENGTLAANKAYLKIQTSANSAAKILKFSIVGENGENDDNTTDVGNVNALESNKEKAIYNLQGQAVKNPSKGLYIINGKKIVK